MHVCNHFSLCSQTWHRVKRSADFIFSIYISKQRKVVSIVTIFQSNRFKELTENRISLKNFAKNRNWYWGQNVSHAKFVYRETRKCVYDELICKHGDRPVNQNSRGTARKPSQLHCRSSAGFILEFPLDERSHESMQKRMNVDAFLLVVLQEKLF